MLAPSFIQWLIKFLFFKEFEDFNPFGLNTGGFFIYLKKVFERFIVL
jgi:hypothetical protein